MWWCAEFQGLSSIGAHLIAERCHCFGQQYTNKQILNSAAKTGSWLSETWHVSSLRKPVFHFLSHWMGYDRGDSFPFDFLNQMEIHLVKNWKENCDHDHIPFSLKGKGNIVFSVWLSEIWRVFRHQFRAPLIPLSTIVFCAGVRSFRGCAQLGYTWLQIDASVSDNNT